MKKNRKKIAYILSQFPSYDETFILREMKGIDKNGIELYIFSLRSFRDKIIHNDALPFLNHTFYSPFIFSIRLWLAHFYFITKRPIKYFKAFASVFLPYISDPNTMIRNLALFPIAVYFAKLVENMGLKHVHAGWATYPATAGLVIAKLSGASFSFAGHAHDIYLERTALSTKINAADFVVTCTAYNFSYLKSLCKNGTGGKIHVSYHGFDLTKFEPNGYKKEDNEFHILSVGSLQECKGFEYLINACGKLRDQGLNFKCIIVGGGKLERELRVLISQLQLDNLVRLAGYVTQEEIVKYYHWADTFVLAAVLEIHWGIPNVIAEAAAARLPVLCTELPSLNELIEHQKSGLIIPNKDSNGIAEALQKLKNEPETRKRLAAEAYRNVQEKFDQKKTVGFLTELFEGVVQ